MGSVFFKMGVGKNRRLVLCKRYRGLSFRLEIRNLGLGVGNGKRPARPQRPEGRNGQKGTLSQNGYGADDVDPTVWLTTPKPTYVVCLHLRPESPRLSLFGFVRRV